MAESANLEILSTRSGFNTAVRHIKKTMEIATKTNSNLGDIIYELDDEELTSSRIALLLRMLLIDKLGYKSASTNLESTVSDLSVLAKEFGKWNGVDLVAAYMHPEMGLLIANPKVAEELAGFGQLRKRELMVVYAGLQDKEADENCQKAADMALKLFEGSKVTPPAAFTKGKFTVKNVSKPKKAGESKPAPKAKAKAPAKGKAAPKKAAGAAAAPVKKAPSVVQVQSSGGPAKMTPRYAVVVQNELFHNGNVEAWKRIIASYKAKHPALEVFIYYEGERILDINSLFKWGKVKHGSAIEFAVAGNEIQDVAKLQRYLAQGASHMFEAFLHGQVNTVLKLF
jgi:hypothetical protein